MRHKTFTAVTLLVAASFTVSVNAPSIGSGYGFITFAVALAVLLLFDPPSAGAAVLLGELAGLPLVAASRSMLLPVALLGVVLRPIVAYASSLVKQKRGPLAGALALSALTPLIATLAGILYYGDDGIHVGLSIFNTVVVLMAYAGYTAWRKSRGLGLASWLGTALYVAGTAFFPSPAAAAGALAALAPLAQGLGRVSEKRLLAGTLLLLALGVAIGGPGLWANAMVEAYPLKPTSYTSQRWTLTTPCTGRIDAFQGVHDPARLRIVHDCVTVRGVVTGIPFTADDGDYCFNLRIVEANATPMLTLGNIILRHGSLHVEIIPQDRQLLDQLGGMICKGDELVVTGVHVVDTDHGQWAEIHPALQVTLVKRGPGPCTKLIPRPGEK